MAVVNQGSGPTIGTMVLEQLLVGLIRYGQLKEADVSSNPNKLNYITSSVNEDSLTFNASVNFPCRVYPSLSIYIPDYLAGVAFTYGSGATGLTATNLTAAIVEITLEQKRLENDSTKNPSGSSNINWTIQGSDNSDTLNNAVFNASYSLPLIMLHQADGSFATTGKEYLL